MFTCFPTVVNVKHRHRVISTMSFSSLSMLTTEKCLKIQKTLAMCQQLSRCYGIYSTVEMNSAGFEYTGVADAAFCKICKITLSGWNSDVKPFARHEQERPDCLFVKSMRPSQTIFTSSSPSQISIDNERTLKKQKIQTDPNLLRLPPFFEVKRIKEGRQRTFAHWPISADPSAAKMIDAGFFSCNIEDRVICLYCNLICHQWSSCADTPFEVHKSLSPMCPFVTARQNKSVGLLSPFDDNQASSQNRSTPVHVAYAELRQRQASFAAWPINVNSPSVNLAKAGFFYTGQATKVTCFFCDGTWEIQGPHDKPAVEHARRFPHCRSAKNQSAPNKYDETEKENRPSNNGNQNQQNVEPVVALPFLSKNNLTCEYKNCIALPVTQRLITIFGRSIVDKCLKKRFILHDDDIPTDCDLWLACVILQKESEHIKGDRRNLIIPRIAMRYFRDFKRSGENIQTGLTNDKSSYRIFQQKQIWSSTVWNSIRSSHPTSETRPNHHDEHSDLSNLCYLCVKNQRFLACLPCGHLCVCTPCSSLIRSCIICSRDIEAFLRVYLDNA